MLWYVVLSAVLLSAHAEDFGISRRNTVQPPQQPGQQELPYVVRIIAFDSSGQSFGTGSYIGTYGEYGVILTNWHVVFTEGTEGLVHVHFPSGFSSFGAIVKSDPLWDLALIAISKPPQTIPALTISQTPSKPGDPLWIVGWGSGSYRIAMGKCVRYLAPDPLKDGTVHPSEIVEVSVSARKGDSGGPILNQKGELAGVLFGSDMVRNTAGSYCERVNRFLMETQSEMARLPSRPETYFASKEKDGPLHSLKESRNIVPQSNAQQRSDVSDSAGSSFGVRSSSRRYVPPLSNEQQRSQQQTPQRKQESATTGIPLSSLPPPKEVESAVWAETSPKTGRFFQPAKVVQTTHLIPLEPISSGILPPSAKSTTDRYLLKLSADRSDLLFTLFMALNVCFAVGLTCFAVRLLASKNRC